MIREAQLATDTGRKLRFLLCAALMDFNYFYYAYPLW